MEPRFEQKDPIGGPDEVVTAWIAAIAHRFCAEYRTFPPTHPGDRVSPDVIDTWRRHHPLAIYGTAFAWSEHLKSAPPLRGPEGALFITHAAFAALMTGLECKLPEAPNLPDLSDPRIRVALLFHEICHFRNGDENVKKLREEIGNAGPELRPMLEIAGLLDSSAPTASTSTTSANSKATPEPPKEPEPLFTWLHLSDVHFGHPSIAHRWDQKLVLAALRDDLAKLEAHKIPKPRALLITGDIAFSGKKEQYADGKAWIDDIAARLGIQPNRVFLVPGNHDVDRSLDKSNRNVGRLMRGLREGDDLLDEILATPDDNRLLTSRLGAYLDFASAFPAIQSPDPFFWTHTFTENDLPLRIIGLNTALLAADDLDHGKLRLGTGGLAKTITDADREKELVLVLTHHPLRDGWLADQRDANRYVESRAHVHLFGHVHNSDSEEARGGSGATLLRIAAGAAHGDNLPGIPASHGYSIAAVIPKEDGSLRLRIWPRIWSDKNKDFRVDTNNTPPGFTFAEHTIPALRRIRAPSR